MILPSTLEDRLIERIEAHGPIPVSRFMAEANAEYYATHDPFGKRGDFITAPEISQMFGELIGACLADVWDRKHRPHAHYVELGPGRGTLAIDALRSTERAGLQPDIHFVETSPILRHIQQENFPEAQFHDTIRSLPREGPLLIVANEFFDALPVQQFVKTLMGWRELMVTYGPDGFTSIPGPESHDHDIPPSIRFARMGSTYEHCPAAIEIVRRLCGRLMRQGGMLLAIDYGYYDHPAGDTLQAVHTHAYADPFARPGHSDLTAHVDFMSLEEIGAARGVQVFGPAFQGDWLISLGIDARADALSRATPSRAAEIAAAHARLTRAEQMGTLFKVMAFVSPHWPEPAGFE
jgi:SAM-dependent MidA family methyltransferase